MVIVAKLAEIKKLSQIDVMSKDAYSQIEKLSPDELCQLDSLFQKQGKYQLAKITHELYSQKSNMSGMTELQMIQMLKMKKERNEKMSLLKNAKKDNVQMSINNDIDDFTFLHNVEILNDAIRNIDNLTLTDIVEIIDFEISYF